MNAKIDRAAVEVVGGSDRSPGAAYRIIVGALPGTYELHDSGFVARSSDPKRLSDWAFAHGANKVRWDFDLNLCERNDRLGTVG